ncbi:hypothetical protein T265_14482, partial [Opisthorchis viverrini]
MADGSGEPTIEQLGDLLIRMGLSPRYEGNCPMEQRNATESLPKLCVPGYHQCVARASIPYLVSALTAEHLQLQLEDSAPASDRVKLIAAMLIAHYSLLSMYLEDDQLWTDGNFELVYEEPAERQIHRVACLMNGRAKNMLDCVLQLIVITKLWWWQSGSNERVPGAKYRRLLAACELDLTKDLETILCVGHWASTLRILSLRGIATRDHFVLWKPLGDEALVKTLVVKTVGLPVGVCHLTFCAYVFRLFLQAIPRDYDIPLSILQIMSDTVDAYTTYEANPAVFHPDPRHLTGVNDLKEWHDECARAPLGLALPIVRKCFRLSTEASCVFNRIPEELDSQLAFYSASFSDWCQSHGRRTIELCANSEEQLCFYGLSVGDTLSTIQH